MIKLTNDEIMFASLVGSEVAEKIPRFQMVQNEAMKLALPKIPFLPINNQEVSINERNYSAIDSENWKADRPDVENQFFPLSFRRVGTSDPFFTLPYEPLINISGSNEIIMRKVAKAPNFIGTIKERWTQNDYEITITGSIFGLNMIGSPAETFPRQDFERLRDYCTHPNGLEIQCEPLQLLGINSIVVTDFTFPFTKGENVQAYEINAVSDFSADFLLEIDE